MIQPPGETTPLAGEPALIGLYLGARVWLERHGEPYAEHSDVIHGFTVPGALTIRDHPVSVNTSIPLSLLMGLEATRPAAAVLDVGESVDMSYMPGTYGLRNDAKRGEAPLLIPDDSNEIVYTSSSVRFTVVKQSSREDADEVAETLTIDGPDSPEAWYSGRVGTGEEPHMTAAESVALQTIVANLGKLGVRH